jgi:hypothetical protein
MIGGEIKRDPLNLIKVWKQGQTPAAANTSKHQQSSIMIIINPCKPYHFGIGTAPHPLGRWRVD